MKIHLSFNNCNVSFKFRDNFLTRRAVGKVSEHRAPRCDARADARQIRMG